jgi:hypothetical protein
MVWRPRFPKEWSPVIFKTIAPCLCLAGLGCSQHVAQIHEPGVTVWRASVANGDKPGNGIELVERAGEIRGAFFLLDPNRPHDFSAGCVFPTEVTRLTESEFRFVVRLNETVTDEFVIRLDEPLKCERVSATLREVAADRRQPISLVFVREK